MLGWYANDVAGLRGQQPPALAAEELKELPPADQLARMLDHLEKHGVIDAADRALVGERYPVFAELAGAFLAHRPVAAGCRAELLVAAEGGFDPVPRWRAIGQDCTVHQVPGSHYTMLQPPQLAAVAGLLDSLLASADAGTDTEIAEGERT